MPKIPLKTKKNVALARFKPLYADLTPAERLKAVFAYDVAKSRFGVTDDLGNMLTKGTPEYAEAKRKMRENGIRIAKGLPFGFEPPQLKVVQTNEPSMPHRLDIGTSAGDWGQNTLGALGL